MWAMRAGVLDWSVRQRDGLVAEVSWMVGCTCVYGSEQRLDGVRLQTTAEVCLCLWLMVMVRGMASQTAVAVVVGHVGSGWMEEISMVQGLGVVKTQVQLAGEEVGR